MRNLGAAAEVAEFNKSKKIHASLRSCGTSLTLLTQSKSILRLSRNKTGSHFLGLIQSLQNIIRPQRISADFLKFIWRPVQRRRCHKASPRWDFRSTKAGRRQIPRGATRKHLEHKVRQHPRHCGTSWDIPMYLGDLVIHQA